MYNVVQKKGLHGGRWPTKVVDAWHERFKIERRLGDEARAEASACTKRDLILAAFAVCDAVRPGHFRLGRRKHEVGCCVCDALERMEALR